MTIIYLLGIILTLLLLVSWTVIAFLIGKRFVSDYNSLSLLAHTHKGTSGKRTIHVLPETMLMLDSDPGLKKSLSEMGWNVQYTKLDAPLQEVIENQLFRDMPREVAKLQMLAKQVKAKILYVDGENVSRLDL